MPQKLKHKGSGTRECKWCNQCKKWRLLKNFHRDRSKKSDGLNSRCKWCTLRNVKEWANANPDKKTALMRRRTRKIQIAENIYPILLLCMALNVSKQEAS